MSDSTSLCLNPGQLPLEVWHVIFYYLDVPDIWRIRRVSRYLNEASHHRSVWNDAYCRAEFVRPPGPFPSQSTQDLDNVLGSSFRVDRNIRHGHSGGTAQRPTLRFKPKRIQCAEYDIGVDLVFGRFLLTASSDKVRCYDLNRSNSRASIIYKSTTDRILWSFDCVSAIDVEGRPFACAVLGEEIETTNQISIYSFNVGEQSKVTLDLLHRFEGSYVDSVCLGPRVVVVLDLMGGHVIAMDVHARTQFILPSFDRAKLEAAEITEHMPIDSIVPTNISTSTHLLLSWSYYEATGGWRTFFQVFTLPPSDTHRCFTFSSTPLSPSHSGIIFGIRVRGTVLLHDSIFDPTTQDVLIAIRVHSFKPSFPHNPLLKHGVLRLSAAPTSHDHKVGTIAFQLLGSLGPKTPFLHPSFNGLGRTFYMLQQGSHGILSALEYDLRISGKDGGKQEAKVVEFPSVLRFSTPRNLLDYDPYSGRICLQPARKNDVIEIYDLSV